MMMALFLQLRDGVNAAGLLLMLLAAACATPAPQVAATAARPSEDLVLPSVGPL